MAANVEGIFDKTTKQAIEKCKLLVVGAGGIGCELLKILVLTGFEDIHVIDLDTIDLSNLNRQFLFHKQHIGKPKAVVARESVLKFNPKAKITAYHDSITNTQYNVQFYRQFTAVANALDNIAARSHVNRMCMAADVPLIESGSAGYLGQTTVYKRKVTECFECLPRKKEKTYPGCTIRNTPSEPVHCVVWAKHLFNQLFGEADSEDEVSPDITDPEIVGTQDSSILSQPRMSVRAWARTTLYEPQKVFSKLFSEDINYLRSMTDLWRRRKCPEPLTYDSLCDAVPGSSQEGETEIADLKVWSMKQCAEVFTKSISALYKRLEEGGRNTVLVWDKDDDDCLDFVAACANLRSYCFHIKQKCRFDIKAIAGNIIPAIATTNAIVGGLVVLQILKLMKGDLSKCKTSWINETYRGSNKLISSGQLEKPKTECLVCSTSETEVKIKVNVKCLTLRTLDEKILKEKLLMIQPDVVINDGSGKILISSEEEDMSDEMFEKALSCFQLDTDSRLLCEDFFQSFKIHLVIQHDKDLKGQDFVFESEINYLKPTTTQEIEDVASSSGVNLGQDDDVTMLLPACKKMAGKDSNKEESGDNSAEPPAKKIKSGL